MAQKRHKMVAFEDTDTETPSTHRFLRACDQNDVQVASKYLNRGIDPNCHEGDFKTALHIAADNNYIRLLDILLKFENININARNEWGVTPLYQACARNNIESVSLLIKYNADVNIPNKHDGSPLHISVLMWHRELVKILLENGAQVNNATIFGTTPLHHAVLNSPSRTNSELLVQYGANLNVNNGIALPILLEGALSCQTYYQLHTLMDFVNLGCNINIKDKMMGRTALHIVAISNYLPLAEFLVEKGANTEIRDFSGKTPLYIAEKQCNDDMVDFLKDNINEEFGKLHHSLHHIYNS